MCIKDICVYLCIIQLVVVSVRVSPERGETRAHGHPFREKGLPLISCYIQVGSTENIGPLLRRSEPMKTRYFHIGPLT